MVSRLLKSISSVEPSKTVWNIRSIPLTSRVGTANLDDISKAVNKKLKNDDENFSLVQKDKKSDPTIQLQYDILKDVIETRIAERDAKDKEKEQAERKQKILEIIAEKKDKNLKDLPIEELEKLLVEEK